MSRHALPRDPRAHWFLLVLGLAACALGLVFNGYVHHEIAPASVETDRSCTAPAATRSDGPVMWSAQGSMRKASMPARTVALTFDGGPHPARTPQLLDLLAARGVHGTFFLSGAQVARHPELAKRIRAEGHEIGSYTYTNAPLGSVSAFRAAVELSLTQNALAGSAGVHTRLLRLPHTSTASSVCADDRAAGRRAAEDGYLVVAADSPNRPLRRGAVLQLSSSAAEKETARLLDRAGKRIEFTTVSDGLGHPSGNPDVAATERWLGRGLLWIHTVAHLFAEGMTWLLIVTGGITALRVLLIFIVAPIHAAGTRRARADESAQRRPRRPPLWSAPVTVVVPAHNEEAGIEKTVRSLLASTHGDVRVIVVDDGSTDRTADIAGALSLRDRRVSVISQPNRGKAAALNAGMRRARSELILTVDGDTAFEPAAIHHLIQYFTNPRVGAVSGNTKVANRGGILGRWQHLEYVIGFNLDRRVFDVLECMPTVPGAIGAFRRRALVSVGGVSEDTLAEDTDLTMALCRAGWRVVYEESAIAWTEAPSSLPQLWKQRYRWCYGTLQAMWKHRRAVVQRGPAGRFGRRGLTYLALFQTLLPLIAPLVDVFALYGLLFSDATQAVSVWLGFTALQTVCAVYALHLDREHFKPLWTIPLQLFVYRQLMYLVVVQSVVTALLGDRLRWHRAQRTGQQTSPPGPYQEPRGPGAAPSAPAHVFRTRRRALETAGGHEASRRNTIHR